MNNDHQDHDHQDHDHQQHDHQDHDHQHHDHDPYRRTAVPPADHSNQVVLVRAAVLHSERAAAVSLVGVAEMRTFVFFVILTKGPF